MVFWAVVLIVALKYVTFVTRADNQGEGRTMSLLSLALPAAGRLLTYANSSHHTIGACE
jgi:KUP system potassium uptake protein